MLSLTRRLGGDQEILRWLLLLARGAADQLPTKQRGAALQSASASEPL